MPNFDKLSDVKIEEVKKSFGRNKYKKDAFESVINSDFLKIDLEQDNNRVDTFNRLWAFAKDLVRRTQSFGNNRYNKSFNEITSILVKENTFYKSSVLDNYINSEGSGKREKFVNAEKQTFIERTEEFRSKYGNESFTYEGKTKTLNEFFEEYEKSDINDIEAKQKLIDAIEFFQAQNEDYMGIDYNNRYDEGHTTSNDVANGMIPA